MDGIDSIFVGRRKEVNPPHQFRTFPIVKMDNGDELIILYPSNPVLEEKSPEQEEQDALFVQNKVNRLLEIRSLNKNVEKYYYD